ncbi:MAG: glycosyltransferase family 2 protein [Bacteroidales bacterium]|nr:glycosyltransferase family 2 protein [Bacteroidales bacterium]
MNTNDFPLVSVISINYNAPEVTAEMIKSFENITYPNVEIIIIDNASTKGDVDMLKKDFPKITLIKSDKNLGFAGGNNLGIRKAKGEFILLLNNDTEVKSDFLEPLVEKFQNDPSIGAVSPKIYFHHTPNMLQFTGISEISKHTIRSTAWGFGKMDEGQFEEDKETFFAHGAAMMVPKSVIEKVGLMAEIYFLYYEEMDWGQRIRNAGYKIFYVHNSIIYHKESVATGRESPLKTYYMNRARIIYMRRNVKGFDLFIAFLYQNLVAVPKNMIVFLAKGKVDLFKAYLRAVGWNIKNVFNRDLQKNPKL